MKKKIIIMILLLAASLTSIYFINYKENTTQIAQEKTYTIAGDTYVDTEKLEKYAFYGQGVITYNKTKLINEKLSGEVIWQNESKRFYDNVYVYDDYIYRTTDNLLEITNSNGENFILSGISGKIISVSRENNRLSIITQSNTGSNLLYILGENHEIIVDGKEFADKLLNVSINSNADNYVAAGFEVKDNKIVSKLYNNLYEGLNISTVEIGDELVLKTYIIDNNVLAITDVGVHLYDSNGNLMWSFSTFDKLYSSKIDDTNKTIDILVDKNNQKSYIKLTYDGVIKNEISFVENVNTIRNIGDYTVIYGKNDVCLLNGQKLDKIWTTSESINDLNIINKNIYIIQNDGIIKGKIKMK